MIVNINDCNACWEELPPSSVACPSSRGFFSNLAAILEFSMQTRIFQRPHFLTSLRASEVSLKAQAILLYGNIIMNVDYSRFQTILIRQNKSYRAIYHHPSQDISFLTLLSLCMTVDKSLYEPDHGTLLAFWQRTRACKAVG